jgi:hypothetical protein
VYDYRRSKSYDKISKIVRPLIRRAPGFHEAIMILVAFVDFLFVFASHAR